jgi:hypothetical protein
MSFIHNRDFSGTLSSPPVRKNDKFLQLNSQYQFFHTANYSVLFVYGYAIFIALPLKQ